MSAAGRPARIGLIGASWRGEYYLRAAREIPEHFSVQCVLVKTSTSEQVVARRWGVTATTDLEDFLKHGPYDFVVVSVPRLEVPELIVRLIAESIPVLTETPPAAGLQEMRELWRKVGGGPIQVAEQYHYQPHHAARISVATAGLLGDVHTVSVSVAHDYHGVGLVRAALQRGFEDAIVSATFFDDWVMSPRGRDFWNKETPLVNSTRTVAVIDYGDRLGHYDFSGEQYTSPIRSRTISFRGTKGELIGDEVRYLTQPGSVVSETLRREATGIDGDLEGLYLRRISLGRVVHYENAFGGVRLNDDELAVAEVMARMSKFVKDGTEFYGLADGLHDHHIGLLMAESATSGRPLPVGSESWSTTRSALSVR